MMAPPNPVPDVARPVASPRRRLNHMEGIDIVRGKPSPMEAPSRPPWTMNRETRFLYAKAERTMEIQKETAPMRMIRCVRVR